MDISIMVLSESKFKWKGLEKYFQRNDWLMKLPTMIEIKAAEGQPDISL